MNPESKSTMQATDPAEKFNVIGSVQKPSASYRPFLFQEPPTGFNSYGK